MGFDADNQTATVGGILGVMYGASSFPAALTMPIEGWTMPFNDCYINITRYDMPDASIQDIIARTVKQAVDVATAHGGKVSGDHLIINTKAQFKAPLEFCVGPDPRMEVNVPVSYHFSCAANESYAWTIKSGTLPQGLTFSNGQLTGTAVVTGKYPVTLALGNGKKTIEKQFELLVRTTNIAPKADTIFTNVRTLNEDVLYKCWITFGKPMYAKSINVINDGFLNGSGSVFYSLAAESKIPKVDYFGYGWKTPKKINMLAFHVGCMEEFGGWLTSLNIQYKDKNGRWKDVGSYTSTPGLPKTDVVFFQPHFVEYVFEFEPVETTQVRIIGDTKVQDHWNKATKNTSAFTSITELGVYEVN
jgi:hypothetical protein